MNLVQLSFSYIQKRKLSTFLNVLLLALGIATIVVLLLFSRQFEENLTRDARGIDAVIGAKGSPLQLILSSIYHMDVPTGNVPMAEAEQVVRSPMVKQAIPLALGDAYRGYRVVGTTHAYPEHYGAQVAEGALWDATYEVTLGADVAAGEDLAVGDELVTAHGLGEGGQAHGEHPLRVAGILAETGTVIDRLVLTSVETVWAVHGSAGHGAGAGPADADHGDEAGDAHAGEAPGAHADEAEDMAGATAPPQQAPTMPRPMTAPGMPGQGGPPGPGGMPGGMMPGPEYTALLVQYASPIAAAMFPRFVNSQTSMMAASPAFETTRLMSLLGVGVDAIRAFAIILILAAALSVFIALYNALKERQYDLAVMRSLGASRGKLLWHLLLEGLLLAFMGTVVGLVLGHVATAVLGAWLAEAQQLELTAWTWAPGEWWLIVLAAAVGLLSALIPAIQAYRTDIAHTLAA